MSKRKGNQLKAVLEAIVLEPSLHAKWINTLSLMENIGSRKIAASESSTEVNLMVLKHAAEEARHAFFLKKQIEKVSPEACPNYRSSYLLAPSASRAYLILLDIRVCRYLKNRLGLTRGDLKSAAYLLVTYAIEVRAGFLYPLYQQFLKSKKSPVSVMSIIKEEEGHLREMRHQLAERWRDWETHSGEACVVEEALFNRWQTRLSQEVLGR